MQVLAELKRLDFVLFYQIACSYCSTVDNQTNHFACCTRSTPFAHIKFVFMQVVCSGFCNLSLSDLISHSRLTRSDSHAGSWYTAEGKAHNHISIHHTHLLTLRLIGEVLNDELSQWLSQVDSPESYPISGCKAIIAPFVRIIQSLSSIHR